MKTFAWVALCVFLLGCMLAVQAMALECQLHTERFPAMQLSIVSRHCWETPNQIVIKPAAEVKKVVHAQPKRAIVKRKTIRHGACGSKRQVWRVTAGGHRKYRCAR